MTRLRQLTVSSLVLCALFLATACSCSNSEQERAIERQKQVEQQERDDVARSKDQAERQLEQAREATRVAEPEVPAEPEKVTMYSYNKTLCSCSALHECGVSFWECEDGRIFACQHDVTYTLREFIKTEKNNINCED